jgi:hypothetical protein
LEEAYYLLLVGDLFDVEDALDALAVPTEPRSLDVGGSEEELFAVIGWANPGLPDRRPDLYERGLTAAQVTELAARPPP